MDLIANSSMFASSLFSAFEIAELSSFLIKSAPFFFEKFSISKAYSTPNPLIWSATKPAFCGESLAPLRYALTSIMFLLFYLLNVI